MSLWNFDLPEVQVKSTDDNEFLADDVIITTESGDEYIAMFDAWAEYTTGFQEAMVMQQ